MRSRIEDYALISDCQAAALVAKNGSIDWLCLPHFDSAACFAAIVGGTEHGRWRIAPAEPVTKTHRHYDGATMILETVHETSGGSVTVIDFMPLRGKAPDIARIVACTRGQVRMTSELTIRFDYGSIVPWVRKTPHGLRATAGPDALRLTTPVALRGQNLETIADFTVNAGDRVPFVLTWYPSFQTEPQPVDAEAALIDTHAWWTKWASQFAATTEWNDAVLRSLLTLKAMTDSRTGGIVAAPTTSLPERIGGVRNWDYRFCWLRDATFTLRALLRGGFTTEARAWREWLLRSVAGRPSELQIMYGVSGNRRLTELELGWLPGYDNSAPVRTGNAAHGQFQLDVYGEVMAALHQCYRAGLPPEEHAWALQRAMMNFLEGAWQKPDEGIWEVRGGRKNFTHSKVMAWVAMDRAIQSAELMKLDGPLDRWRAVREEIHEEVCTKGYDAGEGAFVQHFDTKDLDASCLLIPLFGFLPASDPRVKGTVAAIQKRLMSNGLVMRYENSHNVDGLPPGEGAFLPCSFWLADNLYLQGREDEARALFARLLALRNDVGLLSEEYDPEGGRMLGNFPQAFSHVAMVTTAFQLSNHPGTS